MQPIVLATANPHKVEEMRAIFGAAGIAVVGLNELLHGLGGGAGRGLSRSNTSFTEPAETGRTFEENATIKALSYAAQTGRMCLADDSGLEIDALALPDGTPRPGVISSHYCTDGHETDPPTPRAERDRQNNQRVLRELEGVPPEQRTARFVCVMVLARPERESTEDAEGDREGTEAERKLGSATVRGRELRGSGGCVIAVTRGTFEGRIGVPPRVPKGENGFGYDPLFLVAEGGRFERTGAELASIEKNGISHRAVAAVRMAEMLREAGPRAC